MSAFDTAMKQLFSDQNLAEEAIFIPLAGPNKVVWVIARAPDVYQNIGQSVIRTPSFVLEVQVADCPILVSGDKFLIRNVTYEVQGEPRRDSEHLIWQVDLYET